MNELALFAGAGESAPDVASRELRQEKQVGGPVNCSDSELCTFLQVLGEGYLPTFYSDTSQCVQSKSMSIASRSYQRGKKTVSFHGFQSLQMSRNLTESLGAELLTSYLVAFRAKTSAQPAKVLESTASAAVSGASSRGSFARYDRDSSSWKTAQYSLGEDLDEFSETWPRSGSMRNGACYLRPQLARHTCASESGYWPAPNCSNDRTPCESDAMLALNGEARASGAKVQARLQDAAAFWPTPTVRGNYNRKGLTATSGDGLATAVANFPTPHASDIRNRGNLSSPCVQRRIRIGKQLMLSQSVSHQSGQLNPDWVDWLMGWPIGWDALKPLGTDRFREWRQQHGGCFAIGEGGDET